MKRISVRFALISLITLILGACSQTTPSPTPLDALPEAAQLLAQATNDEAVRDYLAEQPRFNEDSYSGLDTALLHTDAFYRVAGRRPRSSGG